MNEGDMVRFIGWNDDEIIESEAHVSDPLPGDVGVIIHKYMGPTDYPLTVRFFRNPDVTTSLAEDEVELVG